MTRDERQKEILQILRTSDSPVSGAALAERLGVSRQIIVQDIAAIRGRGADVVSTTRGYTAKPQASRVFKVSHSDDEVEEELRMKVPQWRMFSSVTRYTVRCAVSFISVRGAISGTIWKRLLRENPAF